MYFFDVENHYYFFSILKSFLLIFGFIQFGTFFIKRFFNFKSSNYEEISLSFGIGITIFLIILYPLLLFFTVFSDFFILLSYFLIVLGCVFILRIDFKNFYKSFKENFFCLLIVILLLFASLYPPSEIDTLAYHMQSGYDLLNYRKIILNEFSFLSYLAGNFQTITAIASSVGAEEFHGLVQGFSLVMISFLFIKRNKLIFYMCYCPLLLPALHLTGKTYLIFVCLITQSVFVFFKTFQFREYSESTKSFYPLVLISSMLYVSFLGKFSFAVIIFFLNFYFFFKLIKNKQNLSLFVLANISCIFIIIFPFYLHRFHFDGFVLTNLDIIYNFKGSDIFVEYLKGYNLERSFINFIIPKEIQNISRVFGPILFIIIFLLFNIKKNKNFIFILFILLSVIIKFKYFNMSIRFFLEEYFVVIKFLAFSTYQIKFYKLIYNLTSLNLILILAINLFFCIHNLNLLFPKNYTNFYINNSYNYELWSKVNQSKNLNKNDLLITELDSSIFYEGKVKKFDFHLYLGETYPSYFINLKNLKPNYLLIVSTINPDDNNLSLLKKYFNLTKIEEFQYKVSTKNIFKKDALKMAILYSIEY